MIEFKKNSKNYSFFQNIFKKIVLNFILISLIILSSCQMNKNIDKASNKGFHVNLYQDKTVYHNLNLYLSTKSTNNCIDFTKEICGKFIVISPDFNKKRSDPGQINLHAFKTSSNVIKLKKIMNLF